MTAVTSLGLSQNGEGSRYPTRAQTSMFENRAHYERAFE